MQILNQPSFEEAEPVISRSLVNRNLLILVGACTVDFEGRASSTLGEGERVIMIKEDRSLTVHKKDRHAPVNYQTAGCDISIENGGKQMILNSTKLKGKDRIQIKFSSLNFVGTFTLQDENDIEVIGTERDMSNLLISQPELIEPGLKLEKREKMIATGGIDIYCKDKDGNYVVVELKRRNAGIQEVTQLKRYVKEVRRVKTERVRGILCAPSISARARTMLDKAEMEFVTLDPSMEKFKEGKLGLVKDQKSLGEF